MTDVESRYFKVTSDAEVSPPASRLWFKVSASFLGMSCLALVLASMPRSSVSSDAASPAPNVDLAGKSGLAAKVFSDVAAADLPPMRGSKGSKSFMKDIAVDETPGQAVTAGLYRLDPGPALQYTYTYDEWKYVVYGKFDLTDGTGQKVTARAGDLMYFPMGTAVNFAVTESTLGFYIGQRVGGRDCDDDVPITEEVKAAAKANPKMVHYPAIVTNRGFNLPRLPIGDSKAYAGSINNFYGPGFGGAMFRLQAGPPVSVTMPFVEMHLVLEGSLEVEDGTGQKLIAKKGDLVWLKKGAAISLSTEAICMDFVANFK